ncbi:MAG TPA: methyltransferase domain-containing protein [Planctomycetota bacterium]|nr:methyltransferase domain-containing protein [Planctomycetota bacterium]
MDANTHDRSMFEYYNNRAPVYDVAYDFVRFPQYEAPVMEVVHAAQQTLKGRRVLEVACGTGFWTQHLADAAAHVTATDATPRTVEFAQQKLAGRAAVQFVLSSAYELTGVPADHDAAFHMRWFSHVPRSRYAEFFETLHSRIGSGSVVFCGDDVIQPHLKDTCYKKPGCEDNWQRRKLPDGSTYEIIKNHFTADELRAVFSAIGSDLQVQSNEYFWWVTYKAL